MPIGVHVSIAGGISNSIDRALALGCDAMQIFGRNPRSWIFTPVPAHEARLFRSKRVKSGLWPVVVHTTYLINLCSPDEANFDKSVSLFKAELGLAEEIGADYLVTHLGSPQAMGRGYAIMRILAALKEVSLGGLGRKTHILFENTSGAGYGFGSSLEDVGELIEGALSLKLEAGLCFDTCHAFAAGYPMKAANDIHGLEKTIEKTVGSKNLKLVHLNDSKGEQGSKLDRHEHIGMGKIGIEGFKLFLKSPNISGTPLILETPKKSEDDDRRNLKAVKDLSRR